MCQDSQTHMMVRDKKHSAKGSKGTVYIH